MATNNGIPGNNSFSLPSYGQYKKIELYELVGKMTFSVVGYPLEYVRVLIQVGHEPIPPKPGKTLFGKPALVLPGAFQYMKSIRNVDGFLGLYRGLTAKLCTEIVAGMVSSTVIEHIPLNNQDEQSTSSNDHDEQKIVTFIHKTLRDTFAHSVGLIASHPFHVVTIRCMCQFIGREEKYSGLLSSFQEIFREDGIKGFFVGLIPRLLGEMLTVLISRSICFVVATYVIDGKYGIMQQSMKTYIQASVSLMVSSFTYPFALIGNILAVNGSGLEAGMPPNMPLYINWADCWSHLRAMGQLKRGSSLFRRYYQGPYMLNFAGNPTFVDYTKFSGRKKDD